MSSIQVKITLLIFSLVVTIIFISGCVADNNQQSAAQQNITYTAISETFVNTIEKNLSIDQTPGIIRKFVSSQKIGNLTYVKTIKNANITLYEFKSGNASFDVNPSTGRVQSAKWIGSGPVIPGISSDTNQSCQRVGEFAKKEYPEIWVSDDRRDMDVTSEKKWPLSINTMYECAWFETLYYPDKNTIPHFTINSRNSVDIVIDPSTGMIHFYEETYVPLNPSISLSPTLSEEQAGELAKQYFEKNDIARDQTSEITNDGLGLSTDNNGNQYLVWALKVIQKRNGIDYGGLVGIDAHDGHVVYHASF